MDYCNFVYVTAMSTNHSNSWDLLSFPLSACSRKDNENCFQSVHHIDWTESDWFVNRYCDTRHVERKIAHKVSDNAQWLDIGRRNKIGNMNIPG